MSRSIEEWRPVVGYEGLYEVSDWGRVKSLKFGKEKLLKPFDNSCGYLHVGLCKDGKKKNFYLHKLVAEAFIPNHNGFTEVNHKDEDKTNNRVENLEWCDRSYNCNYSTRNQRVAEANTNGVLSKHVYQYTLKGELVKTWPSSQECGRNGFNQGNITECCNGKRNKHKGFKWSYCPL